MRSWRVVGSWQWTRRAKPAFRRCWTCSPTDKRMLRSFTSKVLWVTWEPTDILWAAAGWLVHSHHARIVLSRRLKHTAVFVPVR